MREEGQRARAELRGPAPVSLDLPLKAYLPENYIPDTDVRLEMYREMADVRTSRQVQEVAKELRDRFGAPPPPAEALLELLRLRVLALRAGARDVRRDGQTAIITLAEGAKPQVEAMPRWLAQRLRVRTNLVRLDLQGLGERWLEVLRKVLLAMGRGGDSERENEGGPSAAVPDATA
jgi:transcription-repair coupling factor (superfamily II helicase)